MIRSLSNLAKSIATATVFAVAAFVMAGLWLGLAWRLQGRYLDVFRETLSQEITAAKLEFPALDLASLETLLTTLNDVDDRRVIAALDLLAHLVERELPPLLTVHDLDDVPATVTFAGLGQHASGDARHDAHDRHR